MRVAYLHIPGKNTRHHSGSGVAGSVKRDSRKVGETKGEQANNQDQAQEHGAREKGKGNKKK
ncbi:hypothetical protein KSB_19250 [Ktedonobacter robiniae]|uniref:YuzL family protein n=1 Tax=Ktedonobacter robiniae TaxID=2778365 RepID=A0ABQ3ULB0_9CHLR|nr:hypothetical protein KSB_19250 [Ktedonobacter robiniae]